MAMQGDESRWGRPVRADGGVVTEAVVVGAGRSGRAASLLLARLGVAVRLLERNPESLPEGFADEARTRGIECRFGEHGPADFQGADMVVVSPGVTPGSVRQAMGPDCDADLVGEVELAARYTVAPILAVTGTNGKTTVSTMAARMLEAAGNRVFLGGNIGTPLAEYVMQRMEGGERADVLVLELSSFQLMTCLSFHARVAVLCNISGNHLDWHASMEEYVDAKARVFLNQEPADLAVLPADLPTDIWDRVKAGDLTRARIEYCSPSDRFAEAGIPGEHNRRNMEAAFRACRHFGVTEEQALAGLKRFEPMEHRLERAGEARGVLLVNDSKATTVEAVRAALTSFPGHRILLLAGGKFKGGDVASLRDEITTHVARIGLFGDSRDIFESAWQGACPMDWYETLELAMRGLMAGAETGDVLLLAPGTSSFDQYPNYMARGDDFKRVAAALVAESAEGEGA